MPGISSDREPHPEGPRGREREARVRGGQSLDASGRHAQALIAGEDDRRGSPTWRVASWDEKIPGLHAALKAE